MRSLTELCAATIVLLARGAASRSRRSVLTLASLAIVGGLGLGAGTAAAKPSTLDLAWEEGSPHPILNQVQPGQGLKFYTPDAVITTPQGDIISCSGEPLDYEGRYRAGIYSVDESNDQATDKIRFEFSFGSIEGESFSCSREDSEIIVTIRPPGPGGMGVLSLEPNGKATFKTNKKGGSTSVLLYFPYTTSICDYSLTTLKGSATVSRSGFAPLEVAFANQKLKLLPAHSSGFCAKKAALTLPFAYVLTNSDYPVLALDER